MNSPVPPKLKPLLLGALCAAGAVEKVLRFAPGGAAGAPKPALGAAGANPNCPDADAGAAAAAPPLNPWVLGSACAGAGAGGAGCAPKPASDAGSPYPRLVNTE